MNRNINKPTSKFFPKSLLFLLIPLILIGISTILLTKTAVVTAASPLPGDVNGDNSVNISDIGALLAAYGQTASNLPADLDSSGTVNIQDLSIILINYGATGTGTVTCTGAQHTPGGPDGMGGCWPGPDNTGPNAPESSMPAYTGSCTINTPSVTIDSKVINCSPVIVGTNAAGLIIKNSYVKGGVVQASGSASFTIQDSIIDNATNYPSCASNGGSQTGCPAGKYACGDPNNATIDCGVGYKNFTILRTEIMNTNRAAYCENTCTIQDSYFHGTNLWPDETNLAHASSVRNEQFLTLRHNAIGCDYAGPFPNGELGCSADMSGYPDFAPIKNATIDKNLFLTNNIGTGFCAYGGGTSGKPFSTDPTNATNIKFTDNIFQRGANGKCGSYGPVTDFISGRTGNVWTNNNYDNGTVVNPN